MLGGLAVGKLERFLWTGLGVIESLFLARRFRNSTEEDNIMFVLVILVFLSPQQPVKEQFLFVKKGECEKLVEMVKAVSKYRILTSCQQVV